MSQLQSATPGWTDEVTSTLCDFCLQRVHQIGLFPAEAAIAIGLAPEMAIGGGALEDRPVQLQLVADAARGQIHGSGDGLFDPGGRHLAGAVGVHVDRQWTGHANRTAQLQGTGARPALLVGS